MRLSKLKHYVKKIIEFTREEGIAFTLNKVKEKIINKNEYKKNVKNNMFDESERQKQCNFDFNAFGDKGKTKFSIIVPLYNTNPIFLKELIESVQAQTYTNWELCMADGSDNAVKQGKIEELVFEFKNKDDRIKYKKLEKNLGISGNTNAAIELATGEYLAILDHDDILHPSALYENMKIICKKHANVIYSDEMTFENKITDVKSIHFKPDFAIDNLRANNYICHLMVYKKALLEKVGMYDPQMDGSQDHDMILRLCEVADKIVHIPRVLYYWRSHADSVAYNISVKPYASVAGCRAVKNHLDRVDLKGTVESSKGCPTIYRIRYEILGEPLVSIIIPNRNHKEDLKRCIESIVSKTIYKSFEILVIENNSTEQDIFDYYEQLKKENHIKVINKESEAGNFNFSVINNFGVQYAKGEYYIFLNNDTEVISEKWIEEMLMYAQRSDVGAVGAKLYYPNDTVQHGGVILGITGIVGHAHRHREKEDSGYMGRAIYAQDLSAVTAACMMVPKSIFEKVGGFSEEFAVAFNDVDLCLKIRGKGLLILWTPYAELYHFEAKSRGRDNLDITKNGKRFAKEIALFENQWRELLEDGDPYYNINLTKKYEDFSVGEI